MYLLNLKKISQNIISKLPKKSSVKYFLNWKPRTYSLSNNQIKPIPQIMDKEDETFENDQSVIVTNFTLNGNNLESTLFNFFSEAYRCQKNYENIINLNLLPPSFLFQYKNDDNIIKRFLKNYLENYKYLNEELLSQSTQNKQYKILLDQSQNSIISLKNSKESYESKL